MLELFSNWLPLFFLETLFKVLRKQYFFFLESFENMKNDILKKKRYLYTFPFNLLFWCIFHICFRTIRTRDTYKTISRVSDTGRQYAVRQHCIDDGTFSITSSTEEDNFHVISAKDFIDTNYLTQTGVHLKTFLQIFNNFCEN